MDYTHIASIIILGLHVRSLFGGEALWLTLPYSFYMMAQGAFLHLYEGTWTMSFIAWTLWILLAATFILLGKLRLAMSYFLSIGICAIAEVGLWVALASCLYHSEKLVDASAYLSVAERVAFDTQANAARSLFRGESIHWLALIVAFLVRTWQLRQVVSSTAYLYKLVAYVTIKYESPTKTERWFVRLTRSIIGRVIQCFDVDVESLRDEIAERRTGGIKVVVAPSPKRSPVGRSHKLVCSFEDNSGLSKTVLESVNPGNPLRTVNADTGKDILKLAKSQVLFCNSAGVVAGMGTLVNTANGPRLFTLGHVIKSCTAGDETIYVTSALGGSGETKAINLGSLNYERVVSFWIGDVMDHWVTLKVRSDLQSRLSLKAADSTSSFAPVHALVFSPPAREGGKLRYSTGRIERKGNVGLLVFSGSTVPGSSGAGVFIGKRLVSTHVGALDGSSGSKNLSFANMPRGGISGDPLARKRFLTSHNVTLESGMPELKIWNLVDFMNIFDDDNSDSVHIFEDVDASEEEVRYSKFEAMGDEYMLSRDMKLSKSEADTNALMHAMVVSGFSSWADDDDDEEDQDQLLDRWESQGRQDEGRTGKHGVTKPISSVRFRPETSIGGDDSDSKVSALESLIADAKLAVKALELEKGKQAKMHELAKQLAALKSKLADPSGLAPAVDLESVTPTTTDPLELEFLEHIRLAKEQLKERALEAGKNRKIAELQRQLDLLNAKLKAPQVKFETALGEDAEQDGQAGPPQDFGPGERTPRQSTASRKETSRMDSAKSESPSKETIQACKSGLVDPQPPSSPAKGKKRKGKADHSKSGAAAGRLGAHKGPSNQPPTNMLATLTAKLEAMELQIGALKPQETL